ncbi:MAG: tyrosine-type recombinase/integrase [Planctomycetales bacterium]
MPRFSKPSYLLHRPTGQARVRIGGRDIYLGKFGTPESKVAYERVIGDWLAGQDPRRSQLTIDDLALQFFAWADGYYRHRDGTPTSEVRNLREALAPLVELYGNTLVSQFGPLKLKAVRNEIIRQGRCRTNVNRLVHRIRRLFSWGVENEMVAPDLYQGLRAVAALRAGRTEARESKPVGPVDDAVVTATLPYLPVVLQAMVRLQLLTGARPGEICILRPCDVAMRTDGVWTFRPARHKTEHRGKERTIFIGPEGQEILRPFLEREPEGFCFSPAESEAQRNATRRAGRISPMTPSHLRRRAKGRAMGTRYTKDSYCRAVARACEAAFGFPPRLRKPKKETAEQRESRLAAAAAWRAEHLWSPNQLRHTRATLVRERFGIEAASMVLGHSGLKVTEIYAERNAKAAAEVMKQIG